MVIKRRATVEITPDPWETKKKTKSKRRKRLSKEDEEEEGTPLRGIFCLKTRQDMKIFDEKEDCFILDFDPNDSFDASKLSDDTECDEDVAIIHEKGQVFIIRILGCFVFFCKVCVFAHLFSTIDNLGFMSLCCRFLGFDEKMVCVQVACRDFPHPRHLCLKFPFESSQHTSHCNQVTENLVLFEMLFGF